MQVSLVSVLRRVLTILRNEGATALWFKILGELAYRRVWVFEGDLREVANRPSPAVGVNFELLSEHTLEDYVRLVPGASVATARDRLHSGHFCLIGYADGRAVQSSWIGLTRVHIEYMGVDVELASDAAYVYEVYVSPFHRGRGFGSIATAERARAMVARGVTRGCSVVMPENRAGLRFTEAVGYRRVGLLRTVRVLGWRWSWLRALEPNSPIKVAI